MEVPEKDMEAEEELDTISHLINSNKKKKNNHHILILLENANGRLGKAKYHTLRITL